MQSSTTPPSEPHKLGHSYMILLLLHQKSRLGRWWLLHHSHCMGQPCEYHYLYHCSWLWHPEVGQQCLLWKGKIPHSRTIFFLYSWTSCVAAALELHSITHAQVCMYACLEDSPVTVKVMVMNPVPPLESVNARVRVWLPAAKSAWLMTTGRLPIEEMEVHRE